MQNKNKIKIKIIYNQTIDKKSSAVSKHNILLSSTHSGQTNK